MKKLINDLLKKFGYRISKVEAYNFNHIYKNFQQKEKNLIIDVGTNKGQSVDNFLKIYKNYEIHCFEPLKNLCTELLEKYNNDKDIFVNNCALGDETKKIEFYEYFNDVNSSFNRPVKNSLWEKKKKAKLNLNNLIKEISKVQITTVDEYCKKKQINFIELLKIDTQGFENKVLMGAIESIEKKKIKFIQVEFIMGNQYENRLNIIDYEKYLIKNNYRLYGINQKGDLFKKSDISLDLLYVNSDYISVE